MVLWKKLKLSDEEMKKEDPKRWIWKNREWFTYFSFEMAERLFWDSVVKNDFLEELKKFLPLDDENKIEFLTKVLWLDYYGYFDNQAGIFREEWSEAHYWTGTRSLFPTSYAHYISFSSKTIHDSDYTYLQQGLRVRCFQ
jgi:hypothetical protein